MSFVLLTSIALLLAAIGSAVWLLRRSIEPPVLLLVALLSLLAAAAGAVARATWTTPFALDLPTAAAAAGLVAAALALLLVRALARTLRDLESTESLHWRSMETVRALRELTLRERADAGAPVAALLELGCERFGLEIGLVSRVRGRRYELVAIRGPEGLPVAPGVALPLDDTLCQQVIRTGRAVAAERVTDSELAGRAARSVLPLAAYLGTIVRVDGEVYGTLAFASLAERERFTATDKDLVNLLADWLGQRLQPDGPRRTAQPAAEAVQAEAVQAEAQAPRATRPAAARPSPRLSPPLSPGWTARPVPPSKPRPRPRAAVQAGRRRTRSDSADVNAVLRRMERQLRKAAAPRVTLDFELAPDLAPLRDARLALEPVLLSLVSHAAEVMDGGSLRVRTAHLHVAAESRDWVPPVPPDHYLTISISDATGSLDGDRLSTIFEAGEERDAPGRLSMPTLYRMLQRCGGDLSVEVEPGRESTFTVYLPRAGAPAAARDDAPRALAPASPPTGS